MIIVRGELGPVTGTGFGGSPDHHCDDDCGDFSDHDDYDDHGDYDYCDEYDD